MSCETVTASAKDAAYIASLESEIFSDPWSISDIEDLTASENHRAFVCIYNGKICGYAFCSHVAGEAELLRIGVSPDMRRRGIAGSLLDRMIPWLKDIGTEEIFLEVRASNSPALSLYSSKGFSEISVRKSYYREPTEDAVVMRLILGV